MGRCCHIASNRSKLNLNAQGCRKFSFISYLHYCPMQGTKCKKMCLHQYCKLMILLTTPIASLVPSKESCHNSKKARFLC